MDKSFLERGYNEFFERPLENRAKIPDLTAYDVDSYVEGVPGSLIEGGVISSKDGKLVINLETGEITYNGTSLV